jgi:putative Ig domain-containing protein
VHVTVKEAPELVGPGAVRFVVGSDSEVVYSSDGYPTADLTVSGDLPDGIEFTDHGNGTATLGGSAASGALGSYSLTVTASNGVAPDRTLHVDVDVVPHLAFVSTSLPDAAFSTVYSATIVVAGGQPPYDFSLVSGSLPAGLTLNSNGTITGSPTGAIATSTFTVKVRDAADPAETDTRQFALTVGKGATQTITEPFIVTTKKNVIGLNIYLFSARGQLLGGTPAKPLAGQVLRFTSGNTFVCQGTTDSNGKVECLMASGRSLLNPLLTGKITGTYAGNATWKGSTSTAGLAGQLPNP